MKITVEDLSQKGINVIRFTRGRESVKWATAGYNSASIPDRELLFHDLNLFVEVALTPDKQQALWDAYMKARHIFDNVFDQRQMTLELMEVTQAIYEIVLYPDVRSYVYRSGNVHFPANLKEDYTQSDIRSRNYVQRTYLKEEYIDLVILTLGLRFMVPIWGEYVSRITTRSGNEFKESTAYDLIHGSAIDKWEAMERLRAYVDAQIDDTNASLSQLMGALSSVEIPKHLTGLAVVRKLAVSPLNPKSDSDNLIKILYNFVTGTFSRLDTRFGGNIGAKKLVKENAEDDNSSVWDMYKINQDVSDGDKIIMEVFTENVDRMAKHVLPDIDLNRVHRCLAITSKLDDLTINRHHVVLTQWIMGKVISPKGVQTLPKSALLRCMAVTQAVLWEWGFVELALLCTAAKLQSEAEMFTMVEARSKVSKDNVARLNQIYPYWRRETRRQDLNKRSNVAVKAIDTLCEDLNRCEWIPNAPKQLLEEHGNLAVTKRWVVSGNIKNQLAELIIKIHG